MGRGRGATVSHEFSEEGQVEQESKGTGKRLGDTYQRGRGLRSLGPAYCRPAAPELHATCSNSLTQCPAQACAIPASFTAVCEAAAAEKRLMPLRHLSTLSSSQDLACAAAICSVEILPANREGKRRSTSIPPPARCY